MSDRRNLTPVPFAPFDGSSDAGAGGEPATERDTDKPPRSPEIVDPHDMSTRELMIEAVIFAREHSKIHSSDTARLAAGDTLFKQVDAEIEMCMRSIQTLCRLNDAHEAADELGAYLREKRERRNAASDAANGNGAGHQ